MSQNEVPQPKISSQGEWLAARLELLDEEKALTKRQDRINAKRRRLPMVKLEKQYSFDGPEGKQSLADLFEGKRQLIVYHFMFDPSWEKGCPGCTGYVDAIADISMLGERDTHMVLISRAPFPKLEAYKQKKGWTLPWYSSFESDFNNDFDVTMDASVKPVVYNYKSIDELKELNGITEGEEHGLSVFFKSGDDIFHTYSAYARGTERLTDSYALLDVTPYGRQEDFEDSPPGWPQKPTYG